ncbi:MAG TPA: hypothetical protein VHD62_11425 [Opitutaceae bacterium]|nr:hypothetical protein [Opitutaceae bacterium]
MKTFLSLVIVAAAAAFGLSQLSFEMSVSLLFGAGLTAIVIADYGRAARPVTRLAVVRIAASRVESFRLAA